MILSVLNNKGGTGKTTTSVNVATALALRGMKVLLVDLDPQGSATTSFGVEKAKLPTTIYNVLTQNKPMSDALLSTPVENLTLLPSNLDFTGAEVELLSAPGREYILRNALKPVLDRFDHVIVDCPPNIGLLTLNALISSSLLLIAVQCEYYPMEGLPSLLRIMDLVTTRLNAQFDYRIVLTMYDRRTQLSRRVQDMVQNSFGERVLKTVVPRSVRMAEAPSKGIPGILYDKKNPASEAYKSLARELLEIRLPRSPAESQTVEHWHPA